MTSSKDTRKRGRGEGVDDGSDIKWIYLLFLSNMSRIAILSILPFQYVRFKRPLENVCQNETV